MIIKEVKTPDEKEQLDELLWRVLWKPIDLPRDLVGKFCLSGKKIELIIVDKGTVIGGLICYRIGKDDFEIRHLAVDEDYQRKLVGTNLASKLSKLIKQDKPVRIQAYVRNTSQAFFEKIGFEPINEEWIEHPDFKKHGIIFKLFEQWIK